MSDTPTTPEPEHEPSHGETTPAEPETEAQEEESDGA